MIAFVSRTGRHRQRYDNGGSRLVAGCIPYRLKQIGRSHNGDPNTVLEVLMVTPNRGKGLLFPKGGWEDDETKEEAACREALEEAGVKGKIECFLGTWDFSSKRYKKDCSGGGFRTSYMYALAVTDELDSWPEQSRQRRWVSIEEANNLCQREWMRLALEKCVDHVLSTYTSMDSPSQFSHEELVDNCSNFLTTGIISPILEDTKSVYTNSDDDEQLSSFSDAFSQENSTEESAESSSDE